MNMLKILNFYQWLFTLYLRMKQSCNTNTIRVFKCLIIKWLDRLKCSWSFMKLYKYLFSFLLFTIFFFLSCENVITDYCNFVKKIHFILSYHISLQI